MLPQHTGKQRLRKSRRLWPRKDARGRTQGPGFAFRRRLPHVPNSPPRRASVPDRVHRRLLEAFLGKTPPGPGEQRHSGSKERAPEAAGCPAQKRRTGKRKKPPAGKDGGFRASGAAASHTPPGLSAFSTGGSLTFRNGLNGRGHGVFLRKHDAGAGMGRRHAHQRILRFLKTGVRPYGHHAFLRMQQ